MRAMDLLNKIEYLFLFTTLALGVGIGQVEPGGIAQLGNEDRPLNISVETFDVPDGVMRDGISRLSSEDINDLHLGFEEIIRNRIQDNPRDVSPHFSLHLRHKTIREILDQLCSADPRYVWSKDGPTVNVYPRASINDQVYLLNLFIDTVAVNNIPDPDQALTPLSKLFPQQQVGYYGPGLADNSYTKPWTAIFEHLTVRQFINRIAEHMGDHTSWIWRGGNAERMFTFMKGGFHTSQAK